MTRRLFFLSLLCGLGCGAGCSGHRGGPGADTSRQGAAGQPGKPAAVTRGQFQAAVLSKTEAEVVAAVGKPDKVTPSGSGAFWDYTERTKNERTGKVDSRAIVIFQDGRVNRINYYDP